MKEARDIAESKTSSTSNRIIPEIEHLLPDKVRDFGSHTVSFTVVDLAAKAAEEEHKNGDRVGSINVHHVLK